MKKKWITTLLSVMFLTLSGSVLADDNCKEIATNELPQKIQSFVNNHFPGVACHKAYHKDKNEHEVKLADGYQIEFDSNGNWEEIDNEFHAPLPASVISLLPDKAVAYLDTNYPQAAVYNIEKKRHGYEVNLHTDRSVEINFDQSGNYMHNK